MDVETQLGKLSEYNPGTKDEFDPIKMKFFSDVKKGEIKTTLVKN